MKRPHLVHFVAIEDDNILTIRAFISMMERAWKPENTLPVPLQASSPMQSLSLLDKKSFKIKVRVRDKQGNLLVEKFYQSDSFGQFYFKLNKSATAAGHIQVYEVSTRKGLELLLGSFLPIVINKPKKIIISDFDKTLVDTRYATAKEVYYSLSKPLDFFPTVGGSLLLFQSHLEQGFQPFILTASPHFYENAIRDWLYQNEIYTAAIFSKDYRSIFSFLEGDLTPKDIKSQGFYKLNQLVNILLMTGVPQELVLMGDGFESDPLIYLTLYLLLSGQSPAFWLWKNLKHEPPFRLTGKQTSAFLGKFYQLESLLKGREKPKIRVHIRYRDEVPELRLPKCLRDLKTNIFEFYQG